ncbi:VP1 [Warrego virus]|uniref:RNA-directed RNA polymerase n=6 Tax=Warrego virus TaxID=40062 RepID=A0A097I4E5_9REOV|nr:VP1 [Warrego virus]AIT55713.1 VP1 [Warrego virus]
MAVVAQGATVIRRVVERLYPGINYDETDGVNMVYKFSGNIREIRMKHGIKYKESIDEIKSKIRTKKHELYGVQVLDDTEWNEIRFKPLINDKGLEIYISSFVDPIKIDPEEEFLRNYKVCGDYAHNVETFIAMRAKNEMQIFGDLPIKIWVLFLLELSTELNHEPAGIRTIKAFLTKYGEPFHQGFRDLSRIDGFNPCYTTPLLFEMCCMEAILEFNIKMRMEEESISYLEFGNEKIDPIEIIQEFFYICLPHPKKINNMLRSPYSWFVKMWGVGADEIVILHSDAGDDRNSKEVFYDRYQTRKNKYTNMYKQCRFYRQSLKQNMEKVDEAVAYSQELGHHDYELRVFKKMLRVTYQIPFNPSKQTNYMLASLLLSIQTMSGYGRAWVKNESTDFEKIMKPSKDNFIERVSTYTANNFIQAYEEARDFGEEIVYPEDLYTSMLRLARNTSSGFATKVQVRKRFGPKMDRKVELVEVTSRIKALVIFTMGHTIFTETELMRRYNTTEFYQTKGSRDVPIKSTRTIFSINLSVLVPQLVVTLPLNEYFARVGGPTTPDHKKLGGKIIVGDLEATGSRVIDAADCFRNSCDPEIMTIAIDYSEYDTHLTRYNFRSGMLLGIKQALKRYTHLRYEGYTLEQLVDFGYGEGRIANTLWNGKRRVYRVKASDYIMLSEDEKIQGSFRPPIGVKPVTSVSVAEKLAKADVTGEDLVLVSPTDGSDLAKIDTHLSGENSTLIANSMHNKAIGMIIQEEVKSKYGDDIKFLSEQYVGDDTLLLTRLFTHDAKKIDGIIETIFGVVEKCGHEASESKTMITPFSVEKTQTHAKQGIYIPQDRMMLISSERRKDIEDAQGYVRSQVHTMVTKVSRGFSHKLAVMILMLKSTFVGAWKMKRTVIEDGRMRDRKFDSDKEDGYTLVMMRNPLSLFVPLSWNGYGAHFAALNVVMTEDVFVDSMMIETLAPTMKKIGMIAGKLPPLWNETQADKRQIGSDTKMSFFNKMARPTVRYALNDPRILAEVEKLPLGDFAPQRISQTMMHSALLKEATARTLLVAGYELEYQVNFNKWKKDSVGITLVDEQGYITTNYVKMFEVRFDEEVIQAPNMFPDVNLSPEFYLQKSAIGQRMSNRIRMSYIDKIDTILRKDVVMRGFITANSIINILEKIGVSHTSTDLTTLFTLMNIEDKVAQELAEYVTSEKVRFDALRLLKKGIVGDEFSMSLEVATNEMVTKYMRHPHQLTKTELDAVTLYVSQMLMLRSACGLKLRRMRLVVPDEAKERFKIRLNRFKAHAPKLKLIKRLIDINRLSVRALENQYV